MYLAPSFTNYYSFFNLWGHWVIYIFQHLFIWLCQVLVVACELSCGMWDPVPWAGMGHGPPAFESQSPPALDHQRNPSPWYSSSFMSLEEVTNFQFTQLFSCCQDTVATYKSLRNRSRNRKSHAFLNLNLGFHGRSIWRVAHHVRIEQEGADFQLCPCLWLSKKPLSQAFPGGPGATIPCSCWWRYRFSPWSGNWDPTYPAVWPKT